MIKIDAPKDLPTVTLGDSNAAQVGDWVLAMGSPFGLDQTVTAGIISKKERESPYFNVFQRFLQTDAAINRGNSGGPLVNMRGEVIGMNSQIATSTGDYNGIGFALPANETNFVYKQMIAQGKVKRGYLGITLESVHDEFAKVYGLPEAKGAIVTAVTPTENGQADSGRESRPAAKRHHRRLRRRAGCQRAGSDSARCEHAGGPAGHTLVSCETSTANSRRKLSASRLGERPPRNSSRDGLAPAKDTSERMPIRRATHCVSASRSRN